MANASSGGLQDALNNLSQRERMYLGAMLVNFLFLGLAYGVYSYNAFETKTNRQIESYQKALRKLSEVAPVYLANKNAGASSNPRAKRFSAENLTKNKVKLTSFVATEASAAEIKIDNYDEKSLPLSSGKDGGPVVTKKMVRLTIREADMEKLLRMLERIEKSREPVVVERINLREVRRKKGKVRANITVVTYVQKDAES